MHAEHADILKNAITRDLNKKLGFFGILNFSNPEYCNGFWNRRSLIFSCAAMLSSVTVWRVTIVTL